MAEGKYQSKLKKTFENDGWTVLKLSRLTVNGYPDLLLLHPMKQDVFIEVKDTDGELSKLQEYRVKELKSKGFIAIISAPSEYEETVSFVRNLDQFKNLLK